MGKVITIVNQKGGVGKTTLSLGLADALGRLDAPERAEDGNTVVAVDLDPQASLSEALLIDQVEEEDEAQYRRLQRAWKDGLTLRQALEDRIDGRRTPSKTVFEYLSHGLGPRDGQYSLMANEPRAWAVERDFVRRNDRLPDVTAGLLKDLATRYGYVIVDAAPGQSLVTEGALRASDLVLCPTNPDWLSTWGLEVFERYLQEVTVDRGLVAPQARFVATKWKTTPTKLQKQIEEELKARYGAGRLIQLAVTAPANNLLFIHFDTQMGKRLTPRAHKAYGFIDVYREPVRSELLALLREVHIWLGETEPT